MGRSTPAARLYYLDWLRVLTILAIFGLHHCTRFFDTDDWFIKNAVTYPFMQVWLEFCTSWGMPLILLISGASAFMALEKARPGRFILGLILRLLVPLLVGMFTHVPLHIYLERLSRGEFSGSFFAFYPHYFEGMYGFGGNFAWMGSHLWYLELLFIASLLCLPLFLWLKRTARGRRVLQGMGDRLAHPAAVPLLALPTILLILNLDEANLGNTSLGGWSLAIYPLFYVAGFVIVANERLQQQLVRLRWIHLAMGLAFTGAYLFGEFQTVYPTDGFPLASALVKVLDCFVVWAWLLAVFGFGKARLSFTNPFLKYANEAALPFYILHQTVVVALGYFVVQWAIPDLLKYLVILGVSFGVIMGLYEYGVRRFDVMRFLFGMKLLPRPVGSPAESRRFQEAAV
jgi:surface polysaccharide O-acyltransferase-like enzyme